VRLLLDTHTLIWWMADAPELPDRPRSAIADRSNEVMVSIASLWEIIIKRALGKLELNERLRRGGSKRRLGLEAPNYLVVGDRGERAGGDDADAVASGPARRPDPGGLSTPTLRALILSRNSALE
jgi:hypothetical protein